MPRLEVRQHELVRQFDDEARYMIEGLAAVMHVGGVGASLTTMRRGREANRPPAVTLEPRADGTLMLGLVISRPKNGKIVYGDVLSQWDLMEPAGVGNRLDMRSPRHRRALLWGFQLLRALLDHKRRILAKTATEAPKPVMPRVLVQFPSGRAVLDQQKQAEFPNLGIDSNSLKGSDLVDSRVARDSDIQNAINNDTALEDFSPILGSTISNPFYNFHRSDFSGEAELLAAARRHMGRGTSNGATDLDILSALEHIGKPMRLSLFSTIQVVPVESLSDLPAPYGGSMLPPVNWLLQKTNPNVLATK